MNSTRVRVSQSVSQRSSFSLPCCLGGTKGANKVTQGGWRMGASTATVVLPLRIVHVRACMHGHMPQSTHKFSATLPELPLFAQPAAPEHKQ